MTVGYALGNKNNLENEIRVLGEDESNVITYSKVLTVVATKLTKHDGFICELNRQENLTVPYSTIKKNKEARLKGVREAFILAGERPDQFPTIRATLDLWGFDTYLDYLYTICELAFLEGLIPVLGVGFLTPQEMKKMSEISAMFTIIIDFGEQIAAKKFTKKNLGKRIDIKLKSIRWAGKLNVAVSTGLIVGLGETMEQRKDIFKEIASIHNESHHIHEVLLQNFVPNPRLELKKNFKAPTKETMLRVAEIALNILPDDIKVVVPIEHNPDIADFIKLGIRDIGRINVDKNVCFPSLPLVSIPDLEETLGGLGFDLQQRFPLSFYHIKNSNYTKKLGQVFDAYRYKIKKEEQEKQKDAKINANGNQ